MLRPQDISPAAELAAGARVRTLDGLRGVCAAVVVAYHASLVWPASYSVVAEHGHALGWLFRSPLVLAVCGTSSVSVFFVLSGFVLTLSFGRADHERSLPFWIKRAARVWLPYAAAIGASALAMVLLAHRAVPGVSVWASQDTWGDPLTLKQLLLYALMLHEDRAGLDNVMWSLAYEARLAIVFPALYFAMKRAPLLTLAASVGFSVACALIYPALHAHWIVADLARTGRYVYLFAFGIGIYNARVSIIAALGRAPAPVKAFLWLISLGLIAVAFQLDPEQEGRRALFMAGAGSIGVVAAALTPIGLSVKALSSRPAQWLGKVSYSLYLIHVPIIVGLLHLNAGKLPIWTVVALGIAVSLVTAQMMRATVEQWAQSFGRHVARPWNTVKSGGGRSVPASNVVEPRGSSDPVSKGAVS